MATIHILICHVGILRVLIVISLFDGSLLLNGFNPNLTNSETWRPMKIVNVDLLGSVRGEFGNKNFVNINITVCI